MGRRFLRFNVVSLLGIGVRLLGVAVLVSGLGVHYLVATALAVEASILHNFFWHLRWTWAGTSQPGRPFSAGEDTGPTVVGVRASPVEVVRASWPGSGSPIFFRCVAFHASNGLVSMLGAMLLMPALVSGLGLHYLVANVVTLLLTGALNFLLGDRLVFRATGPVQ